MKWVKELVVTDHETIEMRLLAILDFFLEKNPSVKYTISSLDATGKLGDIWTQKLNDNEDHEIEPKQLLDIAREDGQIFELFLNIKSNYDYYIIIRDGAYFNVLGSGEGLPSSVLGNNKNGDLALFDYLKD